MVNKVKACILISGTGSNLESIIKSSRDYNFPIKIELIISNNINAKGLKLAKKYSISYKFFSSKNREMFERNSLFEIKKRGIKFLCLAGFMKVLSNSFIKTFGYKIINIHPSLLPKYKGLNTHRRVLKNNEKYSEIKRDLLKKLHEWMISTEDPLYFGQIQSPHYLKTINILKNV